MTYIQALCLGVIQGFTEFLPVSSSGHLAIVEHLFGLKDGSLVFEIFVHFGTLLAVVLVFRIKIKNLLMGFLSGTAQIVMNKNNFKFNFANYQDFRISFLIIVASIPAGLIGILFEDQIEVLFGNIKYVGIMLIFTGFILFTTKFTKTTGIKFKVNNSLLIGFAQAVSIIPGISRSGMTISTALWCGIARKDAAEFSFIMSVPIIFGATVLKLKDVFAYDPEALLPLLIGVISAFLSGYLALRILIDLISRGQFHHFSYYCFIAGGGVLIYIV